MEGNNKPDPPPGLIKGHSRSQEIIEGVDKAAINIAGRLRQLPGYFFAIPSQPLSLPYCQAPVQPSHGNCNAGGHIFPGDTD